jgi:hypothetical protein
MADPAVDGAVASSVKPETFLAHFRDIRDAKGDAGDRAMDVARAKKAAKRDGIDLDVLKLVEKFHDMDDDEVSIFIHKLRMYSGWLKMPLGAYQAGLEVPAPKASSQADFEKWQAGQDGHKAGLDGSPRDANPYPQGTEKFVAWDKKWPAGFKQNQRKEADKMIRGTGGARSRTAANGNGAGAAAH